MSVFMTNVVLVVLVVIVVILAMTTWTATRARNAAAERARVNIERVSALSAEVDALRLDGIKASGQLGALYGERNAVIAAVEERLGVPLAETIYPDVVTAIRKGLRRHHRPPLRTFDSAALTNAVNPSPETAD